MGGEPEKSHNLLINISIWGLNGGERGIRTLDRGLTYTPLAGERLQPLGHLSGARIVTQTYGYLSISRSNYSYNSSKSFRFSSNSLRATSYSRKDTGKSIAKADLVAPAVILRKAKFKNQELEKRLRKLESFVTSKQFYLHKELHIIDK